MQNTILLLSLITIFALATISSCTFSKNAESTSFQIPHLLDRQERLHHGKEWDDVQNHYMAQKMLLAQKPFGHEAKIKLAQLFVREARVTGEHGHYYPAALQMTDRILNTKEINKDLRFRTLMIKAGLMLSLHEFQQAKEIGLEAYQLKPNNSQILGVLVDAHVELGEYEEAVSAADKMILIKPDLRAYSRISYLREVHGDISGAIEAMTYAVQAGYPGLEETSWSLLTLGNIYKTYGDLTKAESAYREILQTRADYPFAIAELADLHYRNGELNKAEQMLEDAVKIIPEVGFCTQLAEIYKVQNREGDFREMLKEIFLMLKEDNESGHNMNLEYADIYLNLLEDADKAFVYAEEEYSKRPKNIDVNLMMAKVLAAQGNFKSASDHVANASITHSQNPDLKDIKLKIATNKDLSSI